MSAYYNENDAFCAQWLRNLIAASHIALGDVDDRSITDVRAEDLRGYTQCNFFAGIGIWSYALRQAGWPDDQPVWTGSCPCQPFSAAGRSGGFSDERHLWPHWARLIGECRPHVIFGEQVASSDGLAWLDFVCADLEAAGYAIGTLDTCAAGFGAPHIRQRLYFVADLLADTSITRTGWDVGDAQRTTGEGDRARRKDGDDGTRGVIPCGATSELADADGQRTRADSETLHSRKLQPGGNGDMADSDGRDTSAKGLQRSGQHGFEPQDRGPCNGFWRDIEWLPCIDGKARPVEPGTFPLAHGIAGRVGRLRAYGNAICAPQAEEFIRAYMSLSP